MFINTFNFMTIITAYCLKRSLHSIQSTVIHSLIRIPTFIGDYVIPFVSFALTLLLAFDQSE